MAKKVLIVGAAVVAVIVVMLVWRRRANAATAPTLGSGITPQAAITTLTTTPPKQLLDAGVQVATGYVASQIGAGTQAVIPQSTPKPAGTTFTGQVCPEGSYVDPATGKCGTNRFASILKNPAVKTITGTNYNPATGQYYG